MEGKSENKFACLWQDCGKVYANTDALRKHQRQKQHEPTVSLHSVAKLLCPFFDCDKRFPRMVNLCAHVKNEHSAADAIIEQASFENFEKFHEWKLQLEETTNSSYVQHEAAKQKNHIKHHYFYCHRSGQSCKVILKDADRRRVLKSQGICKIEASCTAHMAVSVDVTSNVVTVSFCRYHAGHSLDLGHLRLSKVARLQQGVTISKVMDTMRDRLGQALKHNNLICRLPVKMAEKNKELFGLAPVTQCFLCTNEFTRPRVLDCVHTFCLGCLTGYAKRQGRNPGDRFQCPVCSKNHVVPDGGMEDLPRNIFMEHLLEIRHLENADLANVFCQVCEMDDDDDVASRASDSNKATTYCLDCRQYHCARCSRHHMKQRFSQSHEMVELGKKISADVLKRVKTFCDQHKDKQVEFYCHDCRITFCMSCYVVRHNGHRSCDIGEISEQFYRNVEEDIERVAKIAKDCTKEETYLETLKKEFQRDVDGIRTQIRADSDELRRHIDGQERKLLDDLEQIQETNLRRIQERMDEIQNHVSMLQNFRQYIIEVKDKATPADVSRIGCALHNRANELHTIPYDVDFILDTINYQKEESLQWNNHQKNVIGSVSVVPQVVDGQLQGAGENSGQNPDHDYVVPASQDPQPGCSAAADVKIKEEAPETPSNSKSQSLLKVVKTVLKGRRIQGIAEVKGALYVVRKRREGATGSVDVEVYNLETFSPSLNIYVSDLESPVDMAACQKSSCLYISDSSNNCVHKVTLGAANRKRWPVNEQPGCLSVNRAANVLVACTQAHLVKEYTADGNLVRNISFESSGLRSPVHAVQLESGLLAVCHVSATENTHQICITDVDGALVVPFCKPPPVPGGKPLCLMYMTAFHDEFLFVADSGNQQILLLMAADLDYHGNVLSRSDRIGSPYRMLFVKDTVYVVSNHKAEGQVLVCEYAK